MLQLGPVGMTPPEVVFDAELQDGQDRKGLEAQTGRKGKFMRSALR